MTCDAASVEPPRGCVQGIPCGRRALRPAPLRRGGAHRARGGAVPLEGCRRRRPPHPRGLSRVFGSSCWPRRPAALRVLPLDWRATWRGRGAVAGRGLRLSAGRAPHAGGRRAPAAERSPRWRRRALLAGGRRNRSGEFTGRRCIRVAALHLTRRVPRFCRWTVCPSRTCRPRRPGGAACTTGSTTSRSTAAAAPRP